MARFIRFDSCSRLGVERFFVCAAEYGRRRKLEKIDALRVKIAPNEAMQKADALAGKTLPTTALTLLMKNGKPVYQSIGGLGADSIFIDAETGEAQMSAPPNLTTRFFRQAHFYYFAGPWQVALLILFSLLACLSALTGIYLNYVHWFGGRKSLQKRIYPFRFEKLTRIS